MPIYSALLRPLHARHDRLAGSLRVSSASSWSRSAPGTTTRGWPLLTFAVVIFAAWYMMWMFQRVVFGRPKGVMPDPHDGELTPTEAALLAASCARRPRSRRARQHRTVPRIAGGSAEHSPTPGSLGGAGSHAAEDDHEHGWHTGATSEVPGEERQIWPDLTSRNC